jgi:hypothetical protein
MQNKDTIEFLVDGRTIAVVSSSMAPTAGALVCIKKKAYLIGQVSFCVDYADDIFESRLRCSVHLSESGVVPK